MTVYFVIAGIFAVLGFFVWFWIKAASSGATKVQNQILTSTAEKQEKQLEAAANAPHGKDEVLKRLREQGL